MQRKITNASYCYAGGGAITYACTVQLIHPSGAVVADVECRSTQNLRASGWKEAMAADIRQAVDGYETVLLDTLGRAQVAFPGVESIDGIVAAMTHYVEEVCNGLGS